MKKKILVIGIICMFLLTSLTTLSAEKVKENVSENLTFVEETIGDGKIYNYAYYRGDCSGQAIEKLNIENIPFSKKTVYTNDDIEIRIWGTYGRLKIHGNFMPTMKWGMAVDLINHGNDTVYVNYNFSYKSLGCSITYNKENQILEPSDQPWFGHLCLLNYMGCGRCRVTVELTGSGEDEGLYIKETAKGLALLRYTLFPRDIKLIFG